MGHSQAWQENPTETLMRAIPERDLLVLDLWAESAPLWSSTTPSHYRRSNGFEGHEWVYCMLLNFGGNVGLHGKIDQLLSGFDRARTQSPHLRGIGLTMEGIENNPVMYALMTDLPWLDAVPTREQWIEEYVVARYGAHDSRLSRAWQTLARTVYNCPEGNTQQGTHESLFCARPDTALRGASTWSYSSDYYAASDVLEAGRDLARVYLDRPELRDRLSYDLVDVLRQCVADRGRALYGEMMRGYRMGDSTVLAHSGAAFLELILAQDGLLATEPAFTLARWTQSARALGTTPAESALYEWSARRSPHGATVRRQTSACSATMRTKSGADSSPRSITTAGAVISTPFARRSARVRL